ncbi:MAG: hypothetical protein CR993_02165 [Rhodobacterales bacterium]|nr:MAG: hypothetical protein CR993_02165 [Rhodobacterales bacterium]
MQPNLEDFIGRWRLERRIDDARAGQVVRFCGEARFEAGENGVIYIESGILALPGQGDIRAERRYLWRKEPQGIAVFFEDGRFFHHISPGEAPKAAHYCAPDQYDVAYDFTHWPCWRAVWQVFGPKKQYRSESVYELLA